MSEIDQLIEKLDARWKQWDMYRSAMGEWIVKFCDEHGQRETTADASLTAAMTKATEFSFLPLVPRRPKPWGTDSTTIRKSGSRWEASTPVGYFCTDTKKKAAAAIEAAILRNEQAIANWDELHSWSLNKTEGVDFRYSA